MSFPRDLPFSEAVHWVCTSYQTEKANAWGWVTISTASLEHYRRRYGNKFYDSLQEEFTARREQQKTGLDAGFAKSQGLDTPEVETAVETNVKNKNKNV